MNDPDTDKSWRRLFERLGSPPVTISAWGPGAFDLAPQYDADLPPTSRDFMGVLGPGTLGGFLHFQPPRYLNTTHERMSPFIAEMDPADVPDASDEVLVFADSDNGDQCGWLLTDLRSNSEARVVRFPPRSFQHFPLARSFETFFKQLVEGADLFGIGPLDNTFAPMPPF